MSGYSGATDRPLPNPSPLSAPHWDGAREGRLMVQRCSACQGYVFVPQAACTHCFADALQWVQSPGHGTVYSYTIIHRAPHPHFDPPYCAAIVELDEGWQMVTNIVDTPLEMIEIGMPVRVSFVDVGMVLPMFVGSTLEAAADTSQPESS